MPAEAQSAEIDALRDELRALRASPAIGLPDYTADPKIGRRVGRMLVATCTQQSRGQAAAAVLDMPLDPAPFTTR